MQSLSQSPFLQALGYAIAHSLWQVALLWIVVVLLNGLLKFSSHTRYKIALTAQLAGFAWFLVTLQFYYAQCSKALATAEVLGIDNTVVFQPQAETFNSRLLNYLVVGERVLPYLSVAYLGLLVFLTMKWIRSYQYARVIKTDGLHKIEVEWRLFVKKMTQHLVIKNEIKIYLSDIVKSPLTIGFLKPVILIPIASINHLTTEQLEAVILHELAHIKRSDYLINLIQSVIEIALFFNPFIQLLSKQIRKERENSCDDWVLQFQYNPTMYAEALLQIAYLQTDTAFAMQASGHDKGDLLSRVKRLLNKQEKIFNYRQQLVALVLMTGIFCSIAWFQPPTSVSAPSVKTTSPEQKLMVEPLAAQVDNPWFNPLSFFTKPLKEELQKAKETANQQVAQQTQAKLQEVQDAFTKVTPAALDKINELKLNLNNDMQKAREEATKELANVKWADVLDKAPYLDSAAIIASVDRAFDSKNFSVDWKKLNEKLSGVQLQMSKLQKTPLVVFKKAELQGLIANALTELNRPFSNNASVDNSKQMEEMLLKQNRSGQRRKAKETREQFQRLQELQIKEDSLREMYLSRIRQPRFEVYSDSDIDASDREPQPYFYRHPVYVETPAAPESPAVATTYRYYTSDAPAETAPEPSVASYLPVVKTKRIVVNTGENTKEVINIITSSAPNSNKPFKIVIQITQTDDRKQ